MMGEKEVGKFREPKKKIPKYFSLLYNWKYLTMEVE